jgi:3-oxoacyl-[acyl-carrier-protein] synthase-3
MAKTTFTRAHIAGVVTVVPKTSKNIDDEADLYKGGVGQVQRLKSAIGLGARRVAPIGVTAVDLCTHAAAELLASLGVDKNHIDGLILVTQTPDHPLPFSAAIVHQRLNLATDCAAFDVGLGCSGYVYGLWLAHMMIETGSCNNVLLLAGDTISHLTHPLDRATAPLFGDAGTATLVSRSGAPRRSWFMLHTDGRGAGDLMVKAGGSRLPKSAETAVVVADRDGNLRSLEHLAMNGADVFNFALRVEPESVSQVVAYAGLTFEDIDIFVFHQANRYILTNIARRLKLPLAKVPCDTVAAFGNQSSASIPGAMAFELSRRLSEGPARLVLSGFGVGLSWGSAVVELDQCFVPPVLDYP